MGKFLLASIAAVGLFGAPALAADLPTKAPPHKTPIAAPPYNWSGLYVGANFGYQWGSVTHFPVSPSGPMGGIQAGYNWQSGQFVFGAETDLQGSGADDTFGAYKFSNPWFGTARARAGYAMNNILLYATAGLAYGSGRVEFAGLSESHASFGWTAGAGIEVGFTPHWSAKAEYLFVDLNDQAYVLTGTSTGIQSNMLRFGVNYRF